MNILTTHCILSVLEKLGVLAFVKLPLLVLIATTRLGILYFLVSGPYGASKCQHNHCLIHSFIHSFIQQVSECPLCKMHCTKHKECNGTLKTDLGTSLVVQ